MSGRPLPFLGEGHGRPVGGRYSPALYYKFGDRFGGSGQDPRGLSSARRATYGTASWMGERELKEVLTVEPWPKRRTSCWANGAAKPSACRWTPALNRHIAVFGASGTGKSRGVIRPAIFNIIRRRGVRHCHRQQGGALCGYGGAVPQPWLRGESVQPGEPGARGFLELHGGLVGGYPPGPGAHQRDHRQHQFGQG